MVAQTAYAMTGDEHKAFEARSRCNKVYTKPVKTLVASR
jgi:CheY-like chemotaxis protein